MKRKNRDVKFTNKGYSRVGITSLLLSVFSLIWLIYAVSQTFQKGDAAGNVLGGVGMLALVLQIFAMVFAVRALREEDVFRGIPKAAAVFAAVLLFIWVAVYGLGIYFV
ncbi:MAG: DUF6142 family protein [Lachnospiraceae bacterium]|nr:DUF6142 family protein [Lachnospiraceae bacterium]MDD7176678.1 DUF6142 family protein [bacterium]MDY5518419.1 DUF6142 family protein [Lachnospiraceae bacterium]